MTNELPPDDPFATHEPPPAERARPGGASQLGRTTALSGWVDTSTIRLRHIALVGLILFTSFIHFWRLDQPERCYFDEVYFPTTGAEILHGDDRAWDFFGHENTHPPLSKVLMAAGMGLFGHKDYAGADQGCWGDEDDAAKKTDPDWLYDPFGWRFPGALAGVGTVIFMYLLARHLFKSEVAGLAAGFLTSLDGLLFTQSRIGTPDTYVIFFAIGCLYFLVTRRWLLSGLFLGAAAASKWNGSFILVPLLLLFAWMAYTRWRETQPDPRLKSAEFVLLAGFLGCVLGVIVAGGIYAATDGLSETVVLVGGAIFALGLCVIVGGLLAIVTDGRLRSLPRSAVYLHTAISLPLFFVAVPFGVYMASYIPMYFNGGGLEHWWYLNDEAYRFHNSLTAPHGSESTVWEWPINARPVFLYLGGSYAKIYNLGNPMIFWMAIPALVLTGLQGLRFIRLRLDSASRLQVWGRVSDEQAICLIVAISYVGLWLALSVQSRALFLYHYIPALTFGILALSYMVHRLWYHPSEWGRPVALMFLAVVFATAAYFYPHWAAVDVPFWLDETYYWFKSWR
jgi:dolichyl-phosphate-mannose--protein O-mannosyl transferase